MGPVPDLADRAVACANRLQRADEVLLASHIDADGLTSAAVASSALERAGINFETVFEKQLDAEAIAGIAATDYDTVLFTDFGSGRLDVISDHAAAGDFVPVIADHHQPSNPEDCHPDAVVTTDGYADTEFHCNPLLEGLNGASELSGAGAAYVLARALAEPGDADAPTTTATWPASPSSAPSATCRPSAGNDRCERRYRRRGRGSGRPRRRDRPHAVRQSRPVRSRSCWSTRRKS